MIFQGVQYILDSFIYGLVLLVVFCRVARPKYTNSVKISNHCCIYNEQNRITGETELKLSIRIIDYIPSDVHDAIVGAAITAKIYRETEIGGVECKKDEEVQYEEKMLEFENAFDGGVLFLNPLPLDLIHTVNEDSPLRDLSLELLQQTHIELIVCVSITIESTGNVYQIRRSYSGLGEFAWGYKFAHCVSEECDCGDNGGSSSHRECFVIDFERVNLLQKVPGMAHAVEHHLGEDFKVSQLESKLTKKSEIVSDIKK